MIPDPDRVILSIDPGDIHVGVATWINLDGEEGSAWGVISVTELTPEEAADLVDSMVRNKELALLIVEKFQLYGDKAMQQTGSEFITSQLIGVFRFLCRRYEVPIVIQPASIKNPTRSILRRRGVSSIAKARKAGGHAFDAELHGYHYFETHDLTVSYAVATTADTGARHKANSKSVTKG